MKLSEQTLKLAESSTDPTMRQLLDFYKFITFNPVYEHYITRMMILSRWDKDLQERPISIIEASAEADPSKVNKTEKEVDRVLKFLDMQPDFIEGTNKIRMMLNPTDRETAKHDKRLKESKDIAL